VAFFHDIPVSVSLANLSHNPPFVGTPEAEGVEGYYLKPWFVFDRNELSNPQFGDVVRFILQAGPYTIADFPLGGYIIWNDGHLNWAFRWQTVVPWAVDKDGIPIYYIFYCQRWAVADV